MKYIILFILFFHALFIRAQGDTTAGIFPTPLHFQNDSVIQSEDGFLKLNVVFKPEIVIIKNNNEKVSFSKDSIYGYCKENICYRFYNRDEYKIEDTGVVYIYSRAITEYESKTSVKKIMLYFSKNAESEIIPLSVHNVLITLPFSTDDAFVFKEKFDDQSILKKHTHEKYYDLNIYLNTIFRK